MVWTPELNYTLAGIFPHKQLLSDPRSYPSVMAQAMKPVLAQPQRGSSASLVRTTSARVFLYSCSFHKANPSPGPPVSFTGGAGGLSPGTELRRTRAQAALLCLSRRWLLAAYKPGSYLDPLPDSLPPWCLVALAGLPGWSLQNASSALTGAPTLSATPQTGASCSRM